MTSPADLSNLLSYQDHSIVSRVLLKNPGGTVTLFAFDAGEGLSEHTAPFDALVVGVDGRAEITVGGDAVELGAAQTLTLPAHVPHAVRAIERFKMLLVMIRA
jgi:quercetin dioxygenase-like cupin family protein